MPKIHAHVTPKARKNEVSLIRPGFYAVKTTSPAADNQANLAVTRLLARHLGLKKSQIWLQSGEKSRDKVFTITA